VSRAKGNVAEERACAFLRANGCAIVARNVYFKGGEIDIIAQKNGVVHFVEVKSGRGFEPVYNLTPAKLRRIVRGAELWMAQNRFDSPWQIDALIVRDGVCEWLENVTI